MRSPIKLEMTEVCQVGDDGSAQDDGVCNVILRP